jgi:hypothetical protein
MRADRFACRVEFFISRTIYGDERVTLYYLFGELFRELPPSSLLLPIAFIL